MYQVISARDLTMTLNFALRAAGTALRAPDRTLAFLCLLCRPAVCDAGLHIPDEMVPGAVTLTGLHNLINPIDALRGKQGAGSRGGQLLGLAVENGHDGMTKAL
jgi:hypothetical protein